jgi:DNA-binding CsgD family transcriptional regulator
MVRQSDAVQNIMTSNQNYGLFLRFFDTYAPVGFKGIDPADPLMVDLDNMMERNDQFFHIGALSKLEILFVSKRCTQMMGVLPEDLHPGHFLKVSHPDDIERAGFGRVRLFKMAQNVASAKAGHSLLSSNFRMLNAKGNYTNLLMQLFVFYQKLPYESVFLIQVHTNIDWCRKLKCGYHYYTGNDLSYFRYPDEELLMKGVPFSNRELEIIHLIESGLNSYQIAEKIFLSPQTVYTHRRNILKKSGKKSLSDVIYDLKDQGVFLEVISSHPGFSGKTHRKPLYGQ